MSLDDWKNVFNKNTITSVVYKNNTVNKVILGSTTYWQRLTSISISGTAQVGQKFTASVTPSSTSPTYQWYRGNNAISGANGSSYTVTSSDVGYQLHCKATASGQTVDSNYSSTVDYVWTYHENTIKTLTFTGGRGTGWTSQDLGLSNVYPSKIRVVGTLWQYDWSANPYYKICFNNDQTNIVATNQKHAEAGASVSFDDTVTFTRLSYVPSTINGIFDSRNNGYTFYVYITGYYSHN